MTNTANIANSPPRANTGVRQPPRAEIEHAAAAAERRARRTSRYNTDNEAERTRITARQTRFLAALAGLDDNTE